MTDIGNEQKSWELTVSIMDQKCVIFFTIYVYGWSLTEAKATFRLKYLSVNAQFIHIFIKLDFQMSIDLVLTKRELSFFQILPSLNMIVFPNILVNVSTLYHSRPDFLKKNTTIIEYDCMYFRIFWQMSALCFIQVRIFWNDFL